jgi:hypothetical protein
MDEKTTLPRIEDEYHIKWMLKRTYSSTWDGLLSLSLSLLFLSYRIVLVMYLGDSSVCAKDLASSLPVRRRLGQKRCICNDLSS